MGAGAGDESSNDSDDDLCLCVVWVSWSWVRRFILFVFVNLIVFSLFSLDILHCFGKHLSLLFSLALEGALIWPPTPVFSARRYSRLPWTFWIGFWGCLGLGWKGYGVGWF